MKQYVKKNLFVILILQYAIVFVIKDCQDLNESDMKWDTRNIESTVEK